MQGQPCVRPCCGCRFKHAVAFIERNLKSDVFRPAYSAQADVRQPKLKGGEAEAQLIDQASRLAGRIRFWSGLSQKPAAIPTKLGVKKGQFIGV